MPLDGLVGCALGLVINVFSPGPWSQYAANAQHTALSKVAAQSLDSILWTAPLDLDPQYSGSSLLVHYGSPIVSKEGTVVTTVKTGASGGFEARAYQPDGTLLWTLPSDYSLPPHNWTPSVGGALVLGDNLYAIAGAGGTILCRATGAITNAAYKRSAFYGTSLYYAHASNMNSNVKICSPLMAAPNGNIYFGFRVLGSNAANLENGIATMRPWTSGGAWIGASSAADDTNITDPVMNAIPALSNDGKVVYALVSSGNFGYGYLLCLDSKDLHVISKVRLLDPDGNDALLPDAGTASPMVGPDGDVYVGVLENPFPYNHDRGWLLHFDSTLAVQKPTGPFGWDDTASVVPASAVPSYLGGSAYLVLTKYNNYAGVGGDGVNRVGIFDPNDTMVDPISGMVTMKEILSVAGVTSDPEFLESHPNAVREWCINTAAIDPFSKAAIVNCEDGKCYRWNFVTNSLDQVLTLTAGVGEAYTPTVIGPNGVCYAVNNASMYALGSGLRLRR